MIIILKNGDEINKNMYKAFEDARKVNDFIDRHGFINDAEFGPRTTEKVGPKAVVLCKNHEQWLVVCVITKGNWSGFSLNPIEIYNGIPKVEKNEVGPYLYKDGWINEFNKAYEEKTDFVGRYHIYESEDEVNEI